MTLAFETLLRGGGSGLQQSWVQVDSFQKRFKGCHRLPLILSKVILPPFIDRVRTELDQIQWMEKKSRLFAQDFLKHFELFFAKERYRGQIVDKPWTDLLGSWNGLLGSWKDLLGPWSQKWSLLRIGLWNLRGKQVKLPCTFVQVFLCRGHEPPKC